MKLKKTKLLVMTASIVLGLGFSVYAKLPSNSIVVGNNVYSISYFQNDSSGTNIAKVNDQLANNLGKIYYVDSSGSTKDIFTGSTVGDSQIISQVGNTLTYYPGNGTTQKIVADANNNFLDPTNANGGYAIAHVTYKALTGGLNLFTCQLNQLSGVSGASYFQVGQSPMTPLTDVATYMGQLSTGSDNMLHLYASDGSTELANGYLNIVTNGNTSGDLNLTVNLSLTGNSTGEDSSTPGSDAYNISNNGFAAIDKSGKWIYYSNTADGGKIYRKSVSGTYDFPICNDSAKFINVVGDWVYYSNYDDDGKIYKVQTDGTQEQKVSDDMASSLNVVGDSIYYINHDDKDRIYVQDSQGKRILLNDQAKYLSVTGNFLFYINAADSNKLYSYDIRNDRRALISDVNTNFINACSDFLVFYTGFDGVLYRSSNAQGQLPVPMTVITNIAQKSSTGGYNAVADKSTIICADGESDIYYISNADNKKIYKLDDTGNGYKVVDDSADYINIIGDNLYYVKSGKIYVAPKDGDGTQKGVAIKKPKLTNKVVTVNDLPTFTTDDITKFNFPEFVSCIMSDGSQQTLVVAWDKTIPKPSKGVYTFKGTILGYGNSVSMKVSLDSGTINPNNVKIVNNTGNKDTVNITGLTSGDIVNIYNNSTDTKSLKSAAADANGNVSITGLNLSSDGGSVYITLTKTGRVEGNRVAVQYQAEEPVGFSVDAASQKITGLKPGKTYKVYIQDENSDGTVPVLNGFQATGEADNSGSLSVPTMISKIDGNDDEKQMLRVVASGNVDSAPSAPVEISRAKVPDYVGIDLNLGRITGTTTGMSFTYDDNPSVPSAKWYTCQSGATPISMTRSLKVNVKVQGNGPVLESNPVEYGLFPVPVITGITNGGTYTTKIDPITNKSLFPDVSWNSDSENIDYSATLTKDGVPLGSVDNGSELISRIKTKDDGNYVLTVTAKKTVDGMGSATNSTTVNFTVSSAVPSPVDINFIETAGTKSDNKVPTYYQATPTWVSLAGTIDTTIIQRVDYNAAITDPKDDSVWSNAAKVSFVQNSTITQDGYYKLTVTSTSRENGATSVSTKVFRVDRTDTAVLPTISGVSDGGIYNNISGINITDIVNCITKATIMRDGYTTDYIVPESSYTGGHTQTGKALTVNGNYVLTLNTTNIINGATTQKTVTFKIDNTEINPTPVAPDAPTEVGFTFNDDGTAKLTGISTGEEYSLNNGQSWLPITSGGTYVITSTNELNLLNGAADSIQVRIRANGNTPASDPEIIYLDSSPAAPSVTFEFDGYDASGKLIGKFSEACQYSIDGGLTWRDTDAAAAGNLQSGDAENINTTNGIWARTKASGTTKASVPKKISIVRANAPSITINDVTMDNKAKLSSLATGLEYRVNIGSTTGTWTDFTSGNDIQLSQAGSIDVRSKAAGTAMPGYTTTITVQAAPTADIDYSAEKITGVTSAVEWSKDGGSTWTSVSGTSIDLSSIIPAYVSSAKDIYVRNKATSTTLGLSKTISVPARQTTPGSADVTIVQGSAAGKTSINVADTLEYRIVDSTKTTVKQGWTTGTGAEADSTVTVTAGDIVQVRVKATGSAFASDNYEKVLTNAEIGD